ncbi:MAG: LPS export ABC transporter periplasmic protein LptC [Halofilum sp. (in: g-proteobacteria)]|nr:LPS export ABC transporter periplasmic protein LptC [Halofilum sp. (in: g-proteobacteria)]
MRILTRIIVIVLVLAAASGLYWVDTLRRAGPAREQAGATPHEPDAYFVDFTMRRFEQAGAPTWRLDGERMTRFADDRTALIERPDLDYRPVDAAPWRATAARAKTDPDGDRVDLINEVVLRQLPTDAAPMTIRTSRLTVLTGAGRADTDRPITAEGREWRIDATGMTAWFDRDVVELHHEVNGRYEPQTTR